MEFPMKLFDVSGDYHFVTCVSLYCNEGTSDKVYFIAHMYHKFSLLHQVVAAYGRRGHILNTSTILKPTAFKEEAEHQLNLTKRNKINKGYVDVSAGASFPTLQTSDVSSYPLIDALATSEPIEPYLISNDYAMEIWPLSVVKATYDIYPGRMPYQRKFVSSSGADVSDLTLHTLFYSPNNTFFLTDILRYKKYDIRPAPYRLRRKLLESLGSSGSYCIVPSFITEAEKIQKLEKTNASNVVVFKNIHDKYVYGKTVWNMFTKKG
jgi:hypothetical protein